MSAERDEPPFDWAALVPLVVHPVRVAIIEAMLRTGKPISATDMKHMIEPEPSVSLLTYHFKVLASRNFRVIKQVRRRQVRGAEEKYFRLRDRSRAR
jgi:hypothetical protein